MRPVHRGTNNTVFKHYDDAKPELVKRLGMYCSYCERRIPTLLAVEHIQPKALPRYKKLEKVWENFLLGCTNCNSAKSKKPVNLAKLFIPDRDNTFEAFEYDDLGLVNPAKNLSSPHKKIAEDTIKLVALNKATIKTWSKDQLFSALERASQREQAVRQCQQALVEYKIQKTSATSIGREAAGCGFFSIWMKAFAKHPEVRKELIKAFPGTAADCFSRIAKSVSPRPLNGLAGGSKI